MIREIEVHKYRKIENLKFSFDPDINVISGTNGTCKTSLLHIISNSVKSPAVSSGDYSNPNCFKIVKNTNVILNPKIESLVRDAKNYIDPSNGMKGNLFEVEYNDGRKLKFRKHNSKIANRYAIKPYYSRTEDNQLLPSCPVIYLGLSRLFPTGEVGDELIENVKLNLPDEYLNIISDLYSKLINIKIKDVKIKNVSDFKSGPEFDSSIDGIDSNTISSGEDNLFIILKALVSLSYYYNSLVSVGNDNVSILLIDEFDATLHPSLQEKLFDIINEYSLKYKIQVFMTTHSLSLLEYVLENKQKVIYLLNNYTDIEQIEEPTIIDIKMHLKNDTRDNIYNKKRIPIFMEDDEARFFLNEIFDYFEEKNKKFALVRRFFHLIPCKIGADNLVTIFKDPYLLETSLKSICILDGDKNSNLNKCTITLPGKESPENMFFKYIEWLDLNNEATFWKNKNIIGQGYTKQKYLSDIKSDISEIKEKIEELKKQNGSLKGVERDMNKKIFNKHSVFFSLVIRHWLQNDEKNKNEISLFFNELKGVFCKVCIPNGIERKEWDFDF
ncbi:AAA family ATPase [Xenorhabdus sp. XENO-7]|uniref:AAA family ATPase n=1 Tax=Xenorhabdus aichiensis TaxID=3025874 RepID=A0ABT5M5U5_9GAMM|nr:AAA family ATPase [Xenorhabdus aichiensis]MDC9622410.1 AAA family ATPase [Xenorhabdus aichiensis]